jgi:tyrosinase
MYLLSTTIALTICSHVAALAPPKASVAPVLGVAAPALPMKAFDTAKFARPLTLMDAVLGANASVNDIHDNIAQIKRLMPTLQLPNTTSVQSRDLESELVQFEKRQSTCSNPRVRYEWDSLSTSDKQAFVDGIKCLMRRPSGDPRKFSGSKNRYEDLVVLHQSMTPQVHGNALFLMWHRYLLWTFEDMLRSECNYGNRAIPWFNEANWSGRFQQSGVFSSQWFGTMMAGGRCVDNGQFRMLACNIGPGTRNQRHCLSRNGDESKTANTRQSITDACNARASYADMAACTEGGAHAWGHNGIGAVMQDVFGSPSDPVFYLHHAYIDRNLRLWQDRGQGRTSSVNGNDGTGRPLSMDTTLTMNGIRNDARIRDVLNTQSTLLCYRYV